MNGVAVLVKDELPNFQGYAALYLVTPPIEGRAFVIASAADTFDDGPETYLFPANISGAITSWGELPGSFKGDMCHAEAFKRAGYRIMPFATAFT